MGKRVWSTLLVQLGILFAWIVLQLLKRDWSLLRFFVEVDVNKVIPHYVEVLMLDGEIIVVSVEVPWLPPRCFHCNIFGHSSKACMNKPVEKEESKVVQIWKPKDKSLVNNLGDKNASSSTVQFIGSIKLEW